MQFSVFLWSLGEGNYPQQILPLGAPDGTHETTQICLEAHSNMMAFLSIPWMYQYPLECTDSPKYINNSQIYHKLPDVLGSTPIQNKAHMLKPKM